MLLCGSRQSEFALNSGQRDGLFAALSTLGFAEFQHVIGIGQSFLYRKEFLIGQDSELFPAILAQDFGMEFQHAFGGYE
jgi:hypothetical protein